MKKLKIDRFYPYEFTFERIISCSSNALLLSDGIFALKKGKLLIKYIDQNKEKEIELYVEGKKIKKKAYKDIDIKSLSLKESFVFGIDISSIFLCHDNGINYFNDEGEEESLFSLVKKGGANTIRTRLWLDPTYNDCSVGGGSNDLAKALLIGEITKKLGMSFLLDIHYSDFWADPAKQAIPKSFLQYQSSLEIEKALYDYTKNVLESFMDKKVEIDYVQIGNEITNGLITHIMQDEFANNEAYLLLDEKRSGKYKSENFYRYIKTCTSAVRNVNPSIKTIIHIDRGADYEYSHDFYTNLEKNDVDFDCIGLSYYPYFHGTIDKLIENVTKLDYEFNKEIFVAETSYPYTADSIEGNETVFDKLADNEYPASPDGQAQLLRNISEALASIKNGAGVFYWEPAWLARRNNGWARNMPCVWADQAFFDNDGYALPSLNSFNKIKGIK